MAANLSAAVATPGSAAQEHNLPALVFGVLLTVVIVCGNLLVCLSVLTEKALKTTTNYFIVSLAVADLMLAVLVLPLFVYSEVRISSTPPVVMEQVRGPSPGLSGLCTGYSFFQTCFHFFFPRLVYGKYPHK